MFKFSGRLLIPAVISASAFTMLSAPASHGAVADMLNQLPSGEISCDTAAAYWTNDADYQSRVAQAQLLAQIDSRGDQILAALGRVDAAAESCGLKGTVGAPASEIPASPGAESPTPATSPDIASAPDSAASNDTSAPGSGGTPDQPVTDAEAILGPIRINSAIPTKTIEVLGQGQVEVADADAMMSNFLRQFTIIL